MTGVYVASHVPDTPAIRAMAALAVNPPGAMASHHTAARLLQLPVPDHFDEHVTVSNANDRRRRSGVVCHLASPSPTGRVRGTFAGIPLCLPEQLFIDMAAYLSFVDLVVLGDALVRRGHLTLEQLMTASRESSRRGGAALRAARYVRREVDSAMETRLRLLLVLAGLPEPVVNHLLRNAAGSVMRRFDLCYPDVRVIVEYDGRQHADNTKQWESDILRREELDAAGWRVIVVTSRGIYVRPDETLHRVRTALQERGASRMPSRLSNEWQRHFPVREPKMQAG